MLYRAHGRPVNIGVREIMDFAGAAHYCSIEVLLGSIAERGNLASFYTRVKLMGAQQQIGRLLDGLITEGQAVLKTKWQPAGNWVTGPPSYVDLAAFTKWRARCKLLSSLLGRVGRPWEKELTAVWNNKIEHAITTLGILEAIKVSATEGLLLELQDLILADAFGNLMGQAEYLLEQGYFLASAVVLRAVLEERLRRLADRHSVTISKSKPTLNDYNSELYKASVYDKITFKDVDALAAVGNAAAHADPALTADSVRTMHEGVVRILQKCSS